MLICIEKHVLKLEVIKESGINFQSLLLVMSSEISLLHFDYDEVSEKVLIGQRGYGKNFFGICGAKSNGLRKCRGHEKGSYILFK